MAAPPTTPLVPVEEYLNTSYRPEREYVDGILVERGMPTITHSLLQQIVSEYFAAFRAQFRFKILPNLRTRIVERARYRVPDLALCPIPLPKGGVMTAVPWVATEILSPTDKMSEQNRAV